MGQGQSKVIININVVELKSSMLHAKFQDHRTSGSGEEKIFLKFQRSLIMVDIYERGGHLGHVTWTIYIICFFPSMKFNTKFCFD